MLYLRRLTRDASPKAISGRTRYLRVRLAFHPYPQVIAAVFNRRAFGPPRGLTPASACPGIAHPASRLRHATGTPSSDSLSLRLASQLNLAACQQLAGSFYKRHAVTPDGAPTPCRRTVSGTVSLPSRGAFHLSLTVLVRYRSHGSIQAWRVVPPASDRVSRARPYSGVDSGPDARVRLRGPNPVPPAFPCRSAPLRRWPPRPPDRGMSTLQPRRRKGWRPRPLAGLAIGPLSLAATRGISV